MAYLLALCGAGVPCRGRGAWAEGEAAGDEPAVQHLDGGLRRAAPSAAVEEGERRCPVSGKLTKEGTCPFAKPRTPALGKAATAAAAPQDVDSDRSTDVSDSPQPTAEGLVPGAEAEVEAPNGGSGHATMPAGPGQPVEPATIPEPAKPATTVLRPRRTRSQDPGAPVQPAEAATAKGAAGVQDAAAGPQRDRLQRAPTATSSATVVTVAKAAPTLAAKSPRRKPPAPQSEVKESDSDSDDEFSCPASRKAKALDREIKELKKRMRSQLTQDQREELDNPWLNTDISDAERSMKKQMFLSFYREQYARLKSNSTPAPDTSQYGGVGDNGFQAQGGHRPMPRPKGIQLPPDFRQPIGRLSLAKLGQYGPENARKLISLHGDIFDVSDRPDKYGADGPYWYMAGHDISYGLIIGDDAAENLDKFYDIFKIQPKEAMDRKLQGLMSWWAFYEKEYGSPVGRLTSFDKEWGLPPPPHNGGEGCSVM